MSKNSGLCPICSQPIQSAVHMVEPFLHVKKVETICLVCYSVPKMWYIENEEWFRHEFFNEKSVHSIEEMMQDGFTKIESKVSIKAVLDFWKRNK